MGLDKELLAEFVRKLLRNQAGNDVRRSARRERHDDPHRLVGIGVLGARRSACEQRRGGEKNHGAYEFWHVAP
jgi:hypothetical protein